MKIENVHIKLLNKGGFHSVSNENVTHIKILPYLSVVQSVEGSYDISIGKGERKQTGEGGFFIAPSGIQQDIVHHVNKESGKMTARWIFLDVAVNNTFPLDTLYQFPVIVNDDRKNQLNTLFNRIFATSNIWETYSDCYKLLGYLLGMATPTKNEPHQGVQRALTYITEHYAEQITIQDLANISNMSESNLYPVFKRHMGSSPISYLNNFRLSLAANQMIETDKTINEISDAVGISDPLYFSKLFKKIYKMTPSQYRILHKKA